MATDWLRATTTLPHWALACLLAAAALAVASLGCQTWRCRRWHCGIAADGELVAWDGQPATESDHEPERAAS